MFISTYYRGRVTFRDLVEMDICYITTMNRMIYQERKSKAAQEAKKAEVMEDAMQGDI